MIARFGWRPSLDDQRDLIADTSGIKTLPEVDPRKEMTAIYNQFQLGSCTANSVARVLDYDRIINGESPVHPSRLGIYFEERRKEGQPSNADTGAFGRDGFATARSVGYWSEKAWPYVKDVADPTTDPHFYQDPAARLGAAPYKLTRPYKSVPRTVSALKAVLSNKQMVAFGFTVHESFESADVARTGIVPLSGADEKILGGHEVTLIGYLKSEPNYGLLANSWGTDWGIKGCFLMPWSMICAGNDHRTIYRPA